MFINCKTFFSYRYGTYKTEELVNAAADLGLRSLALTNINGMPDAWDFVGFCRTKGIKPIVGAEIRNENRFCYILLAKNENGFAQINAFISLHKSKQIPYPERPEFGDNVYMVYELQKYLPEDLKSNELIGVKPSQANKLYNIDTRLHSSKYIIRQPVTVQNKLYHNLHRLLRSIDLNTLYTKLTSDDYAGLDEIFIPESNLIQTFHSHPSIIARTIQLTEECGIETELNGESKNLTDNNRKAYTATLEGDRDLLRKLAFGAIPQRYKVTTPQIKERIEKELRVIDQMHFNAYYLILWDIISYARSRGFYYVGRGSGANSIVAYLLQITDVEPIKLDLYFERFLNEFRSSPPDFDIDFSHKDRDEVIDYIFKRYGKDHVALLGMYSTFQSRAIIRELGKVLGLPKQEIDQLVSRPFGFKEDSLQAKILKYGNMMRDMPNHHSIHAGGMLISEKPIYTYTALELPPKGFATSQIDMFVAEKVGLFKLDILSQRGLGHIKDTIELVKKNRGINVDITKVEEFMADRQLAERIRNADTIGCFYIESPAMRQLLMKLKCDDYLTLVAASSIIRPGVAQSGMMKQYIYNYHHPKDVKYLHPKMEELLSETYGVMVYQEDVIKVAHHFGGLDMAEADILRRAMSGKYRGSKHMEELQEKFFRNCRFRGYSEEIVKEVWRQIASFSGYSFSKAHSASFAVESYQSLYLKTYFPIEFMVGVINNFGGFYRTPFYFHELKKAGAEVHAPCVNRSERFTSLQGISVYVGFVHVEKLNHSVVDRILEDRQRNGEFESLQDFIERIQPGLEQLNILVRIGALRFTNQSKKQSLWNANFLQRRVKDQPATSALFAEPQVAFDLPEFKNYPFEDAYDEIEILGFTLADMFGMIDCSLDGITYVKDLAKIVGKEVMIIGQLVTTKDSRTRKNEHMIFGTFLDPAGDWLDTIHWPGSVQQFPFSGGGFYKMKGIVMEDFGVFSVDVRWMEKVGLKSRDYVWEDVKLAV